MALINVLVVDDFVPWHRLVRGMLRAKKDLEIVAVAVDGLEAVQKAEQLQPDLILLDISLPTLNGIEAARRIRQLSPNSKILFVTQEFSVEVLEEAFSLGASGYLLKFDAVRELLLAVDAVLRDERYIGSDLRTYVIAAGEEYSTGLFPSRDASASQVQETAITRVHEVAAYHDDSSFVDGFTRFIETALNNGNPAIAILTQAHQISIRQQLERRNEAALTQERLYIPVNVNNALSIFMVNDWPDATRLIEWAGNAIKRAARTATGQSSRVAICGECAPILWAQGNSGAAIQLERIWDTIAASHDVDILCGYSFATLRRSENSPIFERIRVVHSAAHSL
jgi:DNA-binding NarL/FixJ family response regulator